MDIIRNTKIYLVTNCYGDINKIYIGKTINNSRKNDHKRKYGLDIGFYILEEIKGINRDLWKPRESYWIKYYINLGFNLQNKQLKGGSGVEYHTEDVKNKIKRKKKLNRVRVRKDIEEKKLDIIKQYKEGDGVHIISYKYKCHPDVIKRILRESKIKLRNASESQKSRKDVKEPKRKDLWENINKIKELYLKGNSFTKLGKLFKTSDVQIKNMLKKEKLI